MKDVDAQENLHYPLTHVVVMGVSGCGKTTVAEHLASQWGVAVADADSFHPQSNVDKMASGVPLNDADRAPWLDLLVEWMDSRAAAGQSTVMSCSALKKQYRDRLRAAAGTVVFVHLVVDKKTNAERLKHRAGHFMPAALLQSQLDTLEELGPDELGLQVDNNRPLEEVMQDINAWLERQRGCHAGVNG